jgi:hypothetical protein
MASPLDHPHQIVISEDAARGGTVGHNVRYVLAYGLTGIIAAFAAFALYQGYDGLAARMSQALASSPSDMLQAFAPYAALVFVSAIALGLLLGVWSLVAGPADNGSQGFMRARVAGQFVAIGLIMAMLWMSGG